MQSSVLNQQEKAALLLKLHHSGKLLILPNIWDVLGARMLEDMGYPAVATASAAIAYTNGFQDGEKIPFEELLLLLEKIASSVSIPVTADIERGYAATDEQLEKNILLLLKTGIVGINIEDSEHKNKGLLPVEKQCQRIRLIRKIAEENNVPLFINARTDVLLHGTIPASTASFDEMLHRGQAYKDAGADCFFPILLKDAEQIGALVSQLSMPVNILAYPGIPDLTTLEKLGVARVSLGPGFLKIAVRAMRTIAEQLRDYNDISQVLENDVTSEYLKNLVKH